MKTSVSGWRAEFVKRKRLLDQLTSNEKDGNNNNFNIVEEMVEVGEFNVTCKCFSTAPENMYSKLQYLLCML